MKLSTKIILPIIIISALLILLNGCISTVPDDSPGFTPGTITGIIASPCCSTSAEPVTETCCIAPEYWCFWCQQTWSLQDGIEVVLTYGEDEVATVFTNENGEFTFTNVDPGKNYVVTAYCPDFADNRPLVKDVALEVASSFDTGITDLVSTSLGLVVDFLVLYTDWGPEDISLDAVLADRPNFPNFPKFKKLVYEVRRVVENCEVNLLTDDDVQDALCRAAEEISGLEIGCGPAYTGGEGEGECEDPIAETGGPYSDVVCPGANSTISFNGNALGTGGLTYAWNFGDGGTSNLEDPSHIYLNPFTGSPYTVTLTVTDDCGSTTATTTVTITESDSLEANAGGPYSEEVCPGYTATIAFDSTIISGTGPFTYAWNFGDTGSSTEADPSHTYPVGADTYDVILVVTDKCDKVEAKTTVTITECINTAPKVIPPPIQAISAEGADALCKPTYEFTVSNLASDDELNNLTYSFVGAIPTGMTIDENSGKIVWVPVCGDFGLDLRCNQCGTVCVTVRVQDDGCCQPLYTDVIICIDVFYGPVDGEGGTLVGIGFDGCPIDNVPCP